MQRPRRAAETWTAAVTDANGASWTGTRDPGAPWHLWWAKGSLCLCANARRTNAVGRDSASEINTASSHVGDRKCHTSTNALGEGIAAPPPVCSDGSTNVAKRPLDDDASTRVVRGDVVAELRAVGDGSSVVMLHGADAPTGSDLGARMVPPRVCSRGRSGAVFCCSALPAHRDFWR